jgi:hypothetical protein
MMDKFRAEISRRVGNQSPQSAMMQQALLSRGHQNAPNGNGREGELLRRHVSLVAALSNFGNALMSVAPLLLLPPLEPDPIARGRIAALWPASRLVTQVLLMAATRVALKLNTRIPASVTAVLGVVFHFFSMVLFYGPIHGPTDGVAYSASRWGWARVLQGVGSGLVKSQMNVWVEEAEATAVESVDEGENAEVTGNDIMQAAAVSAGKKKKFIAALAPVAFNISAFVAGLLNRQLFLVMSVYFAGTALWGAGLAWGTARLSVPLSGETRRSASGKTARRPTDDEGVSLRVAAKLTSRKAALLIAGASVMNFAHIGAESVLFAYLQGGDNTDSAPVSDKHDSDHHDTDPPPAASAGGLGMTQSQAGTFLLLSTGIPALVSSQGLRLLTDKWNSSGMEQARYFAIGLMLEGAGLIGVAAAVGGAAALSLTSRISYLLVWSLVAFGVADGFALFLDAVLHGQVQQQARDTLSSLGAITGPLVASRIYGVPRLGFAAVCKSFGGFEGMFALVLVGSLMG